ACCWAIFPRRRDCVKSRASGEKNENGGGRRTCDPMLELAPLFRGSAFNVWELVKAGGWMMLPIVLCSIAAAAIVAERLWTLRASRITPPHLLGQVWRWIKDKKLNNQKLKELRANSPLGQILAAGLANSKHGREIMKECIEEAAARV